MRYEKALAEKFGEADPLTGTWIGPSGKILAHHNDHQATALWAVGKFDDYYPSQAKKDEAGYIATNDLVRAGMIRYNISHDEVDFDFPLDIVTPEQKDAMALITEKVAESQGRWPNIVVTPGPPFQGLKDNATEDWQADRQIGEVKAYRLIGLGDFQPFQPFVPAVERTLPLLQDFAAANWEKVPHFTTSRLGGIQGALWIAPDGSVYDPKVPHFQSAIDAFRGVGKIGSSEALAALEHGDQSMSRDLMRAGFVRVAASVPNRLLGFEHPDFHSLTPEQRATIDNESQHAWQQAWTVETDFGGIVRRGGPGSGHFGHEGRPGQRGGSLPGDGETTISEGRRQGLHSAVDALKVPRTEKWRPVSDALAAIDSVHGIGGVPLNLKVLALSATSGAGHLRVERGPGHFQIKNMSLRILREGETAEGIPQHLELTTAHEFGHMLDWTAFQGIQKSGGDWGDYDKPLQGSRAVWYLGADNDVYGVMKAIKESEAYTDLKVESMPSKAWPGGTAKLVYDSETMRYLREPEELFARAYAQYVAVRSGNEPMLNAVDDLQNAAKHGHPPLAWDDRDFQSIAGAFDRMFGERGWR